MQFLTLALTRLTDFSGRDPRRLFWPYAGVVFALMMIVMGMVNASIMAGALAMMQADRAPDFSGMVLATAGEIAVVVALLAAAVVRRLHDTGRPGYWGLAPLPFVIFSLFGFYNLLRDFGEPGQDVPPLFFPVFFSNMLYMVALVTLIVLLALPTKADANRYGAPPQA